MGKAKSSSAQRRRKEALRRRRRQQQRTARANADLATFDRTLLEDMVEELKRESKFPVAEVAFNPPGQRKMSQLLEELITPYRDETETLEDFNNLVLLGTLAWNIGLLPAEERDVFLKNALKTAPRALRADLGKLLKALILRKLALFPDDDREIIDTRVTELGDRYHLAVAYSTTGS